MSRPLIGAVLLIVLVWMWWRHRPPITALIAAILIGVVIESSSDGVLEGCADAVLNGTSKVIDWLSKAFS